jgi:hypothetical protein
VPAALTVRRLAILAAALLVGCHRAGSGLVRIGVEAAPGLTLDQVEIAVSTEMVLAPGQAALNRQTLAWAPEADGTLQVGLYVPSSVSGTVWAHARGLRGAAEVASATAQSAEVQPGEVTASISLRLTAEGMSAGDGGASDGGDAGAGSDGAPPLDAALDAGPPSDGPLPGGPLDAAGDLPVTPPDGGAPPAGGWTAPANVENDQLAREYETVVAVDPVKGDAVAVFVEKQAQIMCVRYDATAGQWRAPQAITSSAQIGRARVGMDATGRVFVIWTEGAGARESHSRDGGATWSEAALLHASASAINPSLAVGRDNRARAAWEETKDNHNVMFTSYWDGNAWSAAAMPLDSQDFFSTRQASIAVDGSGAGWLAWSQPEPTSTLASARLYVARFTGAPLEPPRILDTAAGSVQPPPVLAMAPDGRAAVALWQQNYAGGGNDLLASLWAPAEGWSAPDKAVVGAGELPSIVMDARGAVTVAYQSILSAGRNVLTVRREAGAGWGQPLALEQDNASPGGGGLEEGQPSPVATVDEQGHVQVAWRKGRTPTTYGLSARRFVPGQGWEAEQTVAARADLVVSWPLSLATTDDGRSLLVWVYLAGRGGVGGADTYSLFASFFR